MIRPSSWWSTIGR